MDRLFSCSCPTSRLTFRTAALGQKPSFYPDFPVRLVSSPKQSLLSISDAFNYQKASYMSNRELNLMPPFLVNRISPNTLRTLKSCDLNSMTPLPKTYRHIDWATYGLHWLLKLSPDAIATQKLAGSEIFSTMACRLSPGSNSEPSSNIGSFLSDGSSSVYSRLRVLKALSAGMRYAFLGELIVRAIQVGQLIKHIEGLLLQFQIEGGASHSVTEVSVQDLPTNSEVILQGGDPAIWFNLAFWRQIKPLFDSRSDSPTYLMSHASRCERRHFHALSGLRAVCSQSSFWYPPPATSSQEMQDYLNHHSLLAAAGHRGESA